MTVTQPTPIFGSGTTPDVAETVRLSVAIMAHPARADLVADLCERLSIGEDRVVWDRYGDRWDTGAGAWEHRDPDADWHLVLQDDALPCRDLIPALEAALGGLPAESVVSLYSDGKRSWMQNVRTAEATAARWIRHRTLIWGVAMAAPVHTIGDMLDYCDRNPQPNYDTRVARYYERGLGWPCFYAWPSLVEHRQVPSLLGHRDGRQARRFIGEDASALDWAGGNIEKERSWLNS